MKLNERHIGEFESRDFLGDDVWKSLKRHYDDCMGFRKTIKGKPNDEQLLQLLINACDVEHYDSVLFHSARLATYDRCTCGSCTRKRQGIEPTAFKKLLEFLKKGS
jgi:hypothetical protein